MKSIGRGKYSKVTRLAHLQQQIRADWANKCNSSKFRQHPDFKRRRRRKIKAVEDARKLDRIDWLEGLGKEATAADEAGDIKELQCQTSTKDTRIASNTTQTTVRTRCRSWQTELVSCGTTAWAPQPGGAPQADSATRMMKTMYRGLAMACVVTASLAQETPAPAPAPGMHLMPDGTAMNNADMAGEHVMPDGTVMSNAEMENMHTMPDGTMMSN
eukprot:COSAG06_NODE_22973_length_706_cov_20.649094_1_plen_214_part_01